MCKKRWFYWRGRIVVAFLIGLILCVKKEEKKEQPLLEGEPPRNQTLYIGGFQWGPPQSFNPLAVTPAWPITGNMNLIYEALFGYDMLDGSLKGIIGKSYSIVNGVMIVTLNEKAYWHNGEALTADDVVYSFNLHRKYSTIFSGAWNFITDVRKKDTYEVEFILNKDNDNPLLLRDIIASVQILPKKIMEKLEKEAFEKVAAEVGAAPSNSDVLNKIREYKNDVRPIGSGPYTLERYSEKEIVLRRVDNYWGNYLYGGKPPAPMFIVHKSYSSNDEFNSALERGELDLTQTFFPKIWEKFSSGVGTWYDKEPYYIPGIIPCLLMSVTKKPFNDVNFRRAVAYSIDYERIRTEAMYGYSPPLRPGFILPFGAEKEFFSEEDATFVGKLYDPEKAKSILKKAGYKWRADGLLNITNPKGELIKLYATCPKGWTDWEATINIAVEGMRAIGINVEAKFLEYSEWDNNLKNGLFDFTMKNPFAEQAASLPWSRFNEVMSSKNLLPVGEIMYRNEGRYSNSKADELLSKIPTITDKEELKLAYRELNKLFLEEIPVIPLMYRPWFFYQYNTKYWKNFPNAKNPYAPPQCLMVGAGVRALWSLIPSQ